MTIETCQVAENRRRFMEEIVCLTVNALDNLPFEERLALWLDCDPLLGCEDAAEVLSVPARSLDALRQAGMRSLLGRLDELGIATDARSVSILLGIALRQPAPKTLTDRIERIVGAPCSGAAVTFRGAGLDFDRKAGRLRPGRRGW